MRMRIAFALAFTFIGLTLRAQTPDTASIRATVIDAGGQPLAGAVVSLENTATGARRSATTDTRGEATFGAVPVSGAWQLRVSQPGFAEATEGPFVLRGGETATFRTTLTPAASGAIDVFGTAAHVRADSPELGTRLDQQAL